MSLTDISSLKGKIANDGATEEGILTSENWNLLVEAVEEMQGAAIVGITSSSVPNSSLVNITLTLKTGDDGIKQCQITIPASDENNAGVFTPDLLASIKAQIQTSQAAADAVVGVINVDEIDNVPASVEDAVAMAKDTKHSRWTLEKDGQNVGVVEIFSDDMGHQLTEVLTTHYVMKSNGTLDVSSHDDTAVYRYYRSYNISSPHLTNAAGTWSVWAETVAKIVATSISMLADSLNSVKTSFEDFSKTKGEAGGLATLDEDGKVPEEQLPIKKQVVAFNGVVSGVAMLGASTESIDGVAYDKEAKRFCGYKNGGTVLVPTVTYYKNWPTRSDYEDTETDVPYTERIYVDMTDCLPYVWNGTEMKCLSVKTVVLTQDEYDALVAADAIDENTYYNILEDE